MPNCDSYRAGNNQWFSLTFVTQLSLLLVKTKRALLI